MMKTLFLFAKDAKKREENLGLHAFKTAHGLAACPRPIETHFVSLRVLRG
jgi:hypothetical protein